LEKAREDELVEVAREDDLVEKQFRKVEN